MITLYGLELSMPVNKIRMCLNALNQEHEFVRVNPLAGETQTESYLKMHPAGKVPAFDDDGFFLFESNAIMRYLCRKHSSDLYPNDIIAQAKVDQWLDFSSIHVSNGVTKIFFNKILAPIIDGAEVDEQSLLDGYNFLKRFLPIVNDQLGTTAFLAGDSMTIADISLLAIIDPAEVLEVDIAEYPHLNAWRKKIMNEAFYKKTHNSYSETFDTMMSG
jgi:glutathione S-transferase